MQPEREKPGRVTRSRARGLWRKKYECRVNKGAHTYALVIPKWHPRAGEFASVSSFYENEERMMEESKKKAAEWERENPDKVALGWRYGFTCSVLKWYECTACKHVETNEKKIRKIV